MTCAKFRETSIYTSVDISANHRALFTWLIARVLVQVISPRVFCPYCGAAPIVLRDLFGHSLPSAHLGSSRGLFLPSLPRQPPILLAFLSSDFASSTPPRSSNSLQTQSNKPRPGKYQRVLAAAQPKKGPRSEIKHSSFWAKKRPTKEIIPLLGQKDGRRKKAILPSGTSLLLLSHVHPTLLPLLFQV